jgi:endo-1,4-beta-xylanase
MQEHIYTVVGRYKGKIDAWDVVNEAFNEDGSYRESRWYQIIGEDYIAKAFQFAREADSEAHLYYNDYNMENTAKRDGITKAIKNMLNAGIPITGIGSQSHYKLTNMPSINDIEKSIEELSLLGIDIMITELDINVLPEIRGENGTLNMDTNIYMDGLPKNIEKELTNTYEELFELYLSQRDIIKRVTFWGISDHNSWLNYLPSERVNYPLLFDRQNNPKDAFFSILKLAESEQ